MYPSAWLAKQVPSLAQVTPSQTLALHSPTGWTTYTIVYQSFKTVLHTFCHTRGIENRCLWKWARERGRERQNEKRGRDLLKEIAWKKRKTEKRQSVSVHKWTKTKIPLFFILFFFLHNLIYWVSSLGTIVSDHFGISLLAFIKSYWTRTETSFLSLWIIGVMRRKPSRGCHRNASHQP